MPTNAQGTRRHDLTIMNSFNRCHAASSCWIFSSDANGLSPLRSTTLPSLSMMNLACNRQTRGHRLTHYGQTMYLATGAQHCGCEDSKRCALIWQLSCPGLAQELHQSEAQHQGICAGNCNHHVRLYGLADAKVDGTFCQGLRQQFTVALVALTSVATSSASTCWKHNDCC